VGNGGQARVVGHARRRLRAHTRGRISTSAQMRTSAAVRRVAQHRALPRPRRAPIARIPRPRARRDGACARRRTSPTVRRARNPPATAASAPIRRGPPGRAKPVATERRLVLDPAAARRLNGGSQGRLHLAGGRSTCSRDRHGTAMSTPVPRVVKPLARTGPPAMRAGNTSRSTGHDPGAAECARAGRRR